MALSLGMALAVDAHLSHNNKKRGRTKRTEPKTKVPTAKTTENGIAFSGLNKLEKITANNSTKTLLLTKAPSQVVVLSSVKPNNQDVDRFRHRYVQLN